MADRPIIFSGPMIKAMLDGRKSQTRRILKPQPPADAHMVRAYTDNPPRPALRNTVGWFLAEAGDLWPCSDGDRIPLRYAPGDRLWVRETFQTGIWLGQDTQVTYRATMDWPWDGPWRSPIFMPRKLSRLTLTVTDVRVQRVVQISRGDAMDEGCPFANMDDGPDPRDWFSDLWNSIHGPDAWDKTPWVAAISFDVHRCNIDQMPSVE